MVVRTTRTLLFGVTLGPLIFGNSHLAGFMTVTSCEKQGEALRNLAREQSKVFRVQGAGKPIKWGRRCGTMPP